MLGFQKSVVEMFKALLNTKSDKWEFDKAIYWVLPVLKNPEISVKSVKIAVI